MVTGRTRLYDSSGERTFPKPKSGALNLKPNRAKLVKIYVDVSLWKERW